MSISAQSLVRELISRFNALTISTPTSSGSTVNLIDTTLNQWLPNDLLQFSPWVYGSNTAVAANRGIQRRARSWTASTSTMVFPYAWPTTITAAGEYEVIRHLLDRTRFKGAINAAVSKLGLIWWRDIVDESLLTQAQTWNYTLPSSANLIADTVRVYIQIDPDESSFPFAKAEDFGLGWTIRESVDLSGTRVLILQFTTLQPTGRIIRLTGQGYFSQLSADSDILPLTGPWEGPALEWVYDYGTYLINSWMSNDVPAGETEKYRVKTLTAMMQARQEIQDMMRAHVGGQIVTPGEEGVFGGPGGDDWRYLGAFRSAGIS